MKSESEVLKEILLVAAFIFIVWLLMDTKPSNIYQSRPSIMVQDSQSDFDSLKRQIEFDQMMERRNAEFWSWFENRRGR